MNDGAVLLIVEDSLTQALQLQYLLEQEGYEVSVAGNGSEALALMERHRPAVIISDVVMPEMDGYELCKRIKESKELKDIPVMLLTALSDPHDVVKALECRADSFVTKPYGQEFLLARIRNVLVSHNLRKSVPPQKEIEVFFAGQRYVINPDADPRQMLDLLFSTYENAVQKNLELERVNKELTATKHELEKRNEELEKLNDQKNQFLGIAAHDLRNPLNLIKGFSEVLLDGVSGVLGKEEMEFLSIINSSSEYMLGLINNLLDISKIEAGKLDLDLKAADLLTVVGKGAFFNRILAEKKQIQLLMHCETPLPDIVIDAAKMEQVLDNIISNAIKFSHSHSSIEIRVTQRDGNHVLLSVKDEGQGIPADELDNLFKPFKKTSVKSTAGEHSTGLGLAIARKIVEKHLGKIWVESEVGKGSTFYVLLPIHHPIGA